MKKNILIGILVLAITGLTYFLLQKPEDNIIKVPVKIEVPIPGKVSTFPPIEIPKPKKEKPRPINNIPNQDKDSILQDALTERDYEEIFKDSIQSITVKSKVQGKLLKQEVGYNIYPDTIIVEKIIKVPIKKTNKVLIGGSGGLNIDPLNTKPSFGPTVGLQNKKDNIITINYDPFQKRINATYLFKLKF